MSTNLEILGKIQEYLTESYSSSAIDYIPKKEDLTFGNTAKKINHVKVFYIDMRKSREILEDATSFWSIKIHKSFLRVVTECIERRDGHLRSFNGDGILAFFEGEKAASRAVRAAMDIKGFVLKINEILSQYSKKGIDFGIGIAQGEILVTKSGKAGDDQTKQDLIWIGIPMYVAVELSELGENPNNIWISHNVRNALDTENYLGVVNNSSGESMWTKHTKNLKSTGNYDVRSTHWYYNI